MAKHPRKKQKVAEQVQPLGETREVDDDAEKDDEERRLESLLFGKLFVPRTGAKGKGKDILVVSDEEDEGDGLELEFAGGKELDGLRDADLFFVDDAQPDAPSEIPDFTFDADPSPLEGSEDEEGSSKQSEGEEGSKVYAGSSSSEKENTPAAPSTPFQTLKKSSKKAAWHDPDDATLNVSLASSKRLRKLRDAPTEDVVAGNSYEAKLRRQFENINPAPSWAAEARKRVRGEKRKRSSSAIGAPGAEGVGEGEEEAMDGAMDIDDLLTRTDGILKKERRGRGTALAKGVLAVERLRDANQSAKAEGDIRALEFHPSPRVPILMTASADRRVRLFNIDGHTNPHLQTVHIPALPLTSATFHPTGSSLLLTGPRPFYYTFDLQSGTCTKSPRGLWGSSFASSNGRSTETNASLERVSFSPSGDILAVAGRRGQVHLVDWRTGGAQVVGSVKMNEGVKAMWWNRHPGAADGAGELMTLSENAEIYVWDVGERRCVKRWKEEGGYGATVMTGDRGGRYMSIGSRTGLVNVYGEESSLSSSPSTPKSLKTIQNLTTSISALRFNHDSQLLAMASNVKKDQMRMVHLPSLTVFSNWPSSSTPLGHVTAIDFSAGSEFVAIGNNRGRVLLYSMPHFIS